MAKTGLALTAVLPWLWNYYVWPDWGPEMTGEMAGSAATLIAALLARVSGGPLEPAPADPK